MRFFSDKVFAVTFDNQDAKFHLKYLINLSKIKLFPKCEKIKLRELGHLDCESLLREQLSQTIIPA